MRWSLTGKGRLGSRERKLEHVLALTQPTRVCWRQIPLLCRPSHPSLPRLNFVVWKPGSNATFVSRRRCRCCVSRWRHSSFIPLLPSLPSLIPFKIPPPRPASPSFSLFVRPTPMRTVFGFHAWHDSIHRRLRSGAVGYGSLNRARFARSLTRLDPTDKVAKFRMNPLSQIPLTRSSSSARVEMAAAKLN